MLILSMMLSILFVALVIASFCLSDKGKDVPQMNDVKFYKNVLRGIAALSVFASFVCLIASCIVTIPVGNVGVPTLFGKVQGTALDEGIHLINPLAKITNFDARQKSHKEAMGVPSRDQLITTLDISIQYRIDRSMAHKILSETGTAEDVISTHMVPKLRSLMREQGKTVERTEDFFKQEVQARLQTAILAEMTAFLAPKGIVVADVLIRSIVPPKVIVDGIAKKKLRAQQAEEQEEELKRFETEQKQKIAQANAELEASRKQAEQKIVLADAQAYEIAAINKAIANNPAYIQLQALKALEAISSNPANQIYFLNGDSPHPLPFMQLGVAAVKK